MAIGVKVFDTDKHLVKFRAPLYEGPNSQGYGKLISIGCDNEDAMLTAINRRHQSNSHRPTEHQGVSDRCVVNRRKAANVLKDIETMSLNNVS
jgi:hypothetical protein